MSCSLLSLVRMRKNNLIVKGGKAVALLLLCVLIPACVSTETLVPPVEVGRSNASFLNEGRRIYLRRCTSCHSPEPVAGYTFAEWTEQVDDMSADAKLNPEQVRKLMAYLKVYSYQGS